MSGAELAIPGVGPAVEIGRGGFGVVYRAAEIGLGRDVAVKVLVGSIDRRAITHFERERRAMAALSGHPNIVAIFRSGVARSGAPYLVMEYVPGGSLADRVAADGPSGWEEVVRIGVQLSSALAFAHRAGVIHRDVKPGNILLDSAGRPKLGDFGIARLDDRLETKSNLVTASFDHAPPEVISGQTPDERSDLYSLASTLYELASGTAAFSRSSDESLIPVFARIAHDPVPDLRRRGVPSEVAVVIERAMAKQPDDRYASAAELGTALTDAQRRLGVAETVMQVPGTLLAAQPRRNATGQRYAVHRTQAERADWRLPVTKKWLAGAAAVIVLSILIGGAAGYLTSRSQSNSQPISPAQLELAAA